MSHWKTEYMSKIKELTSMLKYIQELNSEPVVFTWKWKIDKMHCGIMS